MISIKKFNLNQELDTARIEEYSAFKLGDVSVVDSYCRAYVSQAKKLIEPNKLYIQYGAGKSPLTSVCKKNALLVAEKAAKELHVPLVVAAYTFVYDPKSFYDNQAERKEAAIPVLKKEDIELIKGRTVLLFEDSIVSGLSLKTICGTLEGLTDEILFVSGVDLSQGKFLEKDFNDAFYRKYGLPGLVKIINTNGYIFTTQMMRTIGDLSPVQVKEFLAAIPDKKNAFLKAYEIYFGRPYFL